MDSRGQLGPTSSVAPSNHIAGGGGCTVSQSQPSVKTWVENDGQMQGLLKGYCAVGTVTGEMNPSVLNSTGNSSGPSSLVTDANSALTGNPRLQRNTSFNSESYSRLPASPLSFTSVMDGSAVLQQSPQQGASTATSQLTEQDLNNGLNALKRPRVGMSPDEIMQQHLMQQILQNQNSMQSQAHQNLQFQTMLQQNRSPLHQPPFPQQIVQSLPPKHNLHPQTMQPVTPVKRRFDYDICSRRLMQYLYHQRHRPNDNSISYWRKFVAEYFAPQAKERWCLSMYDSIGRHTLGAFPQPSTDAWQCDICGSKCGKGFEATFEVLPRLSQIKFDHGIVDENLFLGMPHESRLSTGVMILEYKKAVQESVYEHLRIVREGTLRIIFTPELKIFRWDFCTQKHEEFLPRRVLSPQVNQLLQVAQKYQNAVGNENGSSAISHQDLQATCNMFLAAGRQVVKNLELQSLNDLGFSKRYVRCLQTSEVVSSMKDLIDFSREHKIGPIESLKEYTRLATAKFQKQKLQETEQVVPLQNLSADQNTLNKVLGIQSVMGSQLNNDLVASHVNANQRSTQALNNYHNLLRNSLTSSQNQNQNILPQEVSSTLSSVKQGQSMQFQASASLISPNSFVTRCGQYQQQPQFNGCLPQQNNIRPSQVNPQMQQLVIQQMPQGMVNNNRGTPQPSPSTSNANGHLASESTDVATSTMPPAKIDGGPGKDSSEMPKFSTGVLNNSAGHVQTNNFPSSSSGYHDTFNSFGSKSELEDDLDLPDFDHIVQEFAENGMFDCIGERSDVGCDWKV